MGPKDISIVMPVFNTGSYLVDAINSVLDQRPSGRGPLPSYELLIVDDHSDDAETLSILDWAKAKTSRVRVLSNQRTKGAAGARNTGILNAQGRWIGFLDSDDLWLPGAVSVRWDFIVQNPSATWIGAHFLLHKPDTGLEETSLSHRSPRLYSVIEKDYNAGRPSRLQRPLEMLSKSCILGTMTVLIQRDLLIIKQLFNENLPRAEDYHLWFKCAIDNDLWILPADVGIYRFHPNSLTHGDTPKYLHEEKMIDLLMCDPAFRAHKRLLRTRLDFVFQDYCYFYRHRRAFSTSVQWASTWVRRRPLAMAAWQQLAAAILRI